MISLLYTKEKKEKAHISKIRNEGGDIVNGTSNIQSYTHFLYYEKAYANKLDNLEGKNKQSE